MQGERPSLSIEPHGSWIARRRFAITKEFTTRRGETQGCAEITDSVVLPIESSSVS